MIPFLVFALSGGQIPLPLTVLQILAVDLGTETLRPWHLAVSPPNRPDDLAATPAARITPIHARMLGRAWVLLGGIPAALVLSGFRPVDTAVPGLGLPGAEQGWRLVCYVMTLFHARHLGGRPC